MKWREGQHGQRDEVVFVAYGWAPNTTDDAILAALLALNRDRSSS